MKANKSTILKAIKAKCLDCCCGDKNEIKNCSVTNCPLFSFRLGKSEVESTETKTKKVRKPMSEDHKAALKAGREAAKARKGE